MIAVRLIKGSVLGVAAACVLAMAGAAPALAEGEGLAPWWGMTSGERPTDLRAGLGADAVQKLTVSATQGEVAILEPQRLRELEEGLRTQLSELLYVLVPYNATAAEMQKALEALFPDRQVVVTHGQGNEAGTEPYEIVFPDQSVPPLFADGEFSALFPGGEPLSCKGAVGAGCKHEASVAVVSEGKPDGQIVVTAQNRGDGAIDANASPVTLADQLPAGLEPVQIEALSGSNQVGNNANRGPVSCTLKPLGCKYEGTYKNSNNVVGPKVLKPFEQLEMKIAVVPKAGAASGERNSATISGGGAAKAAAATSGIEVNGTERFGVEDYELIPENFGGSVDTQAGSHPFQLTTVVNLNTEQNDSRGTARTARLPKDIVAELPKGLFGNPTPLPQCTDKQFNHQVETPEGQLATECAPDTAIGVATVTATLPASGNGTFTASDPIFNLQPNKGEPARFAFRAAGVAPVFLDTSIRTGGDYGVNVTSHNVTQLTYLINTQLTFWGVPGDPRHDRDRGWECLEEFGSCPPSTAQAPPPFLGMPTSCEAPYESVMQGDSWSSGGVPTQQAQPVTYRLPEALDGCNHLPFDPSITVAPDIPNASSATGLTVGVHISQTATLNPEGLAESTVRNTTVALPEGVALNPAGADGLGACSPAEIGFTGVEPGSGGGTDLFTPDRGNPFCPAESKIGTVSIKTPLLPHALEGAVYLATQNENPFGALVAMYIVAQDPFSGVLVKLPGKVVLDEHTGRVVTTFENTPELPFEELELHFFGGERAPLGTPALCGTYTTETAVTPWSGNETVHPTTNFDIVAGPQGKPCANPLPFKPTLTAGTSSIQAGGFSPFTMTMSREDDEQSLKSIELHMPLGMSGTLSTVKLCGEAQANAGTCGPESEIGETIVSVGIGGDPFSVKGGKVYITGPYKGAPFGLSIVNPAKAGPFDLGKVIVRAKINVNPETAGLTITTDTEGPYKLPTILDGIPLQIRHVNVNINRPNFTFNATNCSPMAITGTLGSSEGATSTLSVPYQITNCAVLAFKPKLEASTSGKSSRLDGTSLNVKLGYPAGPYDANISKVKVELPEALPSRLPTLQKACRASTFEANPAECPAASVIGHATATTPVLPVPLTGPAYFVSHGGEAFPSLIIVLQGYGVTVHLVGTTFISKTGITSSTFKTVPDVPVGSFELNLPAGPYSALTALGNLCKDKTLPMPTEFVGQNGAEIHTTTKIAVTGCAKTKHAKHKQKAKAKHKRAKGGKRRKG